ncbi:pentatricopeptide repeat-containing protein [Tanacetum coccineum]
MMMNLAKKSAVDAFIKLKGTKSFFKHPNPFSLGVGFGPHKTLLASLIHSSNDVQPGTALIHSSNDVQPGTALIHPSNDVQPGSALHNFKVYEDVSYLFNEMIKQQPLPPTAEFTRLLETVTELKNYSASLDMFKQLCSLVDDVETVIKSCCRLYRTNYAFSILGCNFKQGGINIYHVYTFVILLDGLIFEDKIPEALTLFEKSVKHKLCEPNLPMYNTMIKALCSFRLSDHAYKTLKGFPPECFEYNAMLRGFRFFDSNTRLAEKMLEDAVKLWKDMDSQHGISPDVVTYNSLISALCKLHVRTDATLLIQEMPSKGIEPNVETLNIVINAFCTRGKIKEARLVLYYMQENDIDPNLVTFNLILDALCLKGDMAAAKALLILMMSRDLSPDVATYTSFLNGYCISKKMDEAMLTYHEMSVKGWRPDYDSMIRSLFLVARFHDGRKLLDDMRRQGQMLDGPAYKFILKDLFRMNQAEMALSLFLFVGDSNLNSDLLVYNRLIAGFIKWGKLDIAMDLFNDISVKGMKPDGSKYTKMICAFSSEDLLDEAKELLLNMKKSGYQANDDTYNCLLEGYLRNKRYDDVEMILHKMDKTGKYLNVSMVSLLRKLKAGSLDPSLSNLTVKLARKAERSLRNATLSNSSNVLKLIGKLAPKEEMDFRCFSSIQFYLQYGEVFSNLIYVLEKRSFPLFALALEWKRRVINWNPFNSLDSLHIVEKAEDRKLQGTPVHMSLEEIHATAKSS